MTTLTNLVNHTDKYDGVLKELAALLVPYLIAHPDVQAMLSASSQLVTRESVNEIVQAKLDELGPVDKVLIREVCEEVIDASDLDDKITDWHANNFDISDYQSEIQDMIDLDDALEDRLPDAVLSCVQNLRFDVEVSSR